MLKLVSLIVRNVLRNRRRTVLTLASTAVSLAILALMVAMYQGFFHGEDRSPSEALRLITRHKVSLAQPLPASYMQKIKEIDGVARRTDGAKLISAWSWFQGKFREPKDFFARFAVDADTIFDIHQDFSMPPDQLEAFKKGRTACVIGQAIADSENLKIGDRVTIVGDIYPVTLEMTVVGIFQHPKSAESLLFHREYLRELLPEGPDRDTVGTYIILGQAPEGSSKTNPPQPATFMPRIAKAIDAMFENSPSPTKTESEKAFSQSFLAFLGNIKLFLAAICAAVMFTILLVSANTVAMAVRERTRETAILRTLGYTPGEILQLILGEAVLISLMGGVVGLGIGWVLSLGVENVIGGFGFQGIKWQAALIVLGLAGVIGFFAALVPAMVAARKNVVESLRFTG